MRAFLIRKMLQINAKEAFEVEIFRPPFCSTFCSTGKGNILPFFAFRGKRKILNPFGNQEFAVICFFSKWCHQESNRGHKDFQSFALPTELWHQQGRNRFSITAAKVGIYFKPATLLSTFFTIKSSNPAHGALPHRHHAPVGNNLTPVS